MKNSTLLIAGGIVVLFFLFKPKATSATPALVATQYPGSTPAQIGAIATSGAMLATAFKGLFSGPTTAPLTSGASPSNPNDILALPTTPIGSPIDYTVLEGEDM